MQRLDAMGFRILSPERLRGTRINGSLCFKRVSRLHMHTYLFRCVIDSIFRAKGVYFLNTNSRPPYAEGVVKEFSDE